MASQRPFWQQTRELANEYKIEYRYVQHNYTLGRGYQPVAIVIHTMVDVPDNNIEGVYNWFNNPNSKVSAHYGVSTGGQIYQFVRLSDTAWANGTQKFGSLWKWSGNPNPRSISIECEGGPNDLITQEMYNAVKHCCELAVATYRPTLQYIYAHNAIANTQCPGPRWTNGKLQQLGNELGLEVVQ